VEVQCRVVPGEQHGEPCESEDRHEEEGNPVEESLPSRVKNKVSSTDLWLGVMTSSGQVMNEYSRCREEEHV